MAIDAISARNLCTQGGTYRTLIGPILVRSALINLVLIARQHQTRATPRNTPVGQPLAANGG